MQKSEVSRDRAHLAMNLESPNTNLRQMVFQFCPGLNPLPTGVDGGGSGGGGMHK